VQPYENFVAYPIVINHIVDHLVFSKTSKTFSNPFLARNLHISYENFIKIYSYVTFELKQTNGGQYIISPKVA